MALANQPRKRLAALCGLYLIQGMPTGLISIGLAAHLAGEGLPVADVAQLLAVSWIPWGFKCVFGPLLDRFSGSSMGRRRPWMLAAQGGMVLMLIVMIAVPVLDERTTLLMVLIFCHNTFSSLQDVAVDALAVDLLESREHGRANGFMWSAKLGGIGLGGAGLGTVLAYSGLRTALSLLLVAVLFAMLLPLLLREREGERLFPWTRGTVSAHHPSETEGLRTVLAALVRTLQTKRAVIVGLLALFASLPTRMMITLGPIFAVQYIGWDDASFSQFTGGPALLAGVAGAVSGGWLTDRWGCRRVLAAATATIFVTFSAFAIGEPWWRSNGMLETFLLLAVFVDMTLRMGLFALFMKTARGRIAATQFAVFMALCNLCNVLGSFVIVPLDRFLDYSGIFVAGACFTGFTALLLWDLPERKIILAAHS